MSRGIEDRQISLMRRYQAGTLPDHLKPEALAFIQGVKNNAGRYSKGELAAKSQGIYLSGDNTYKEPTTQDQFDREAQVAHPEGTPSIIVPIREGVVIEPNGSGSEVQYATRPTPKTTPRFRKWQQAGFEEYQKMRREYVPLAMRPGNFEHTAIQAPEKVSMSGEAIAAGD